MIEPPFLPLRGKGLGPRPRARAGAPTGARRMLASRARFEHEFRTLYAIGLLQRQALWYARTELLATVVSVGGALLALSALVQGHTGDALRNLMVSIAAALVLVVGRPRTRRVQCNQRRNAFVQLRARSLEYDDTRFGDELKRLQSSDGLWIWSVLRRPTCNAVCHEMGCWADVRHLGAGAFDRAVMGWHAMLGHTRHQARRRLAPVATDGVS